MSSSGAATFQQHGDNLNCTDAAATELFQCHDRRPPPHGQQQLKCNTGAATTIPMSSAPAFATGAMTCELPPATTSRKGWSTCARGMMPRAGCMMRCCARVQPQRRQMRSCVRAECMRAPACLHEAELNWLTCMWTACVVWFCMQAPGACVRAQARPCIGQSTS